MSNWNGSGTRYRTISRPAHAARDAAGRRRSRPIALETLEIRALLATQGLYGPAMAAASVAPADGATAQAQQDSTGQAEVSPDAAQVAAAGDPELQLNPDVNYGPFQIPTVQPSVSYGAPSGSLVYPAQFDLRSGGYVTPVKDQGQCGSCWAFATYGSLESSILMEGGPARDFSENNLKDDHGFDWGPCAGGNVQISQAYLTRGSGPVAEADDPYHPWDDRPDPGGPTQYYVRETAIFDTPDEIKNALMNYGALDTSMEWQDSSYRPSDDTYYYNGPVQVDHDVTIVGWDDTKATAAAAPGAWLIKNSWGTGWGDGGYFWLSYSDTAGGRSAVSFYDAVAPANFSHIYYHDEFGDVNSVNCPYSLSAFTSVGSDPLKAVQFWTQADWANYDIRVYRTFAGGSLSNLLASTSGTIVYAGSHTVDLPAPVPLSLGESFYVYVDITNGGTYPQTFDYRVSGYDSASTAGPGESYYSFDGTTWTDLTTWNATADFSVKALTGSATANQPPTIGALSDSPDPVTLGGTVTLTASGVGDPDGTVAAVAFYRESNGSPGLQVCAGGDLLIGTDTSGADGWTATASTAGLAAGTYNYYARATDNLGATSNVASTANTVQSVGQPDLVPYRPTGWSDRIVISTVPGSETDATRFTTADTLYIDWAVLNQGSAATTVAFKTRLLLNGVTEDSWSTSPPLEPDWYTYVEDFAIPPLAAGSYTLTIQADHDNAIVEGEESNNAYSRNFTVVGPNQPPVLAPIPNQTINELTPLTFQAKATDPDIPAQALTFSLIGAPAGAGIDPTTGVFSWIPTEAQAPGSYTFAVRVTDNGTPSLGDTRSLTIAVNVKPVMVTGAHWQTLKLSKAKKVKVLVVAFSGDLDPVSARNLAAYYLAAAGKDKKPGTRDDKRMALASATYDPGAHAVALRPRNTVPKQALLLRVSAAAVHDIQGRPLDGDCDGQPGGNFSTSFKGGGINLARAPIQAELFDAMLSTGELSLTRGRR